MTLGLFALAFLVDKSCEFNACILSIVVHLLRALKVKLRNFSKSCLILIVWTFSELILAFYWDFISWVTIPKNVLSILFTIQRRTRGTCAIDYRCRDWVDRYRPTQPRLLSQANSLIFDAPSVGGLRLWPRYFTRTFSWRSRFRARMR